MSNNMNYNFNQSSNQIKHFQRSKCISDTLKRIKLLHRMLLIIRIFYTSVYVVYNLFSIYPETQLTRAGFSSGTWEPGSKEIFSLTGNFGWNPTHFKRNIGPNSRTFERNHELETRLGCFDVTTIMSWGWLKLKWT